MDEAYEQIAAVQAGEGWIVCGCRGWARVCRIDEASDHHPNCPHVRRTRNADAVDLIDAGACPAIPSGAD